MNETEKGRLSEAVYLFSTQMTSRFHQKCDEGYTGWDGTDPTDEELFKQMGNDCRSKDPAKMVDIANRALIIWYRSKKKENPNGSDSNRSRQ